MSKHLLVATTILFSALFTSNAQAGFFEVGASGSYRRSNIDETAFDESTSLTGSLSYYLNEASALELSYTDGRSKRSINGDAPNGHVTSMFYKIIGLDLVYTIGGRGAGFRPYAKLGANYIMEKKIVDQYRGPDGAWLPANTIQEDPALVPSAGLGFSLGLTQTTSLKVGVDAWSSRPMNKPPVTIDYAGRVGLSWMF